MSPKKRTKRARINWRLLFAAPGWFIHAWWAAR